MIPFDLYNLTEVQLEIDSFGRNEGLTSTGDNRDKIASMLYYRLETSSLDSVPFYADMLQYGCWCQLLTSEWKATNKGAPVDQLNAICRKWNRCNQCSSIDYEGCTSFTQDYGQPLIDENTLDFTCNHISNDCSRVACECDVALVDELAAYAEEYNPAYSSGEGNFDTATCGSDSYSSKAKTDSCCGEYPNRFPFSSQAGQRQCCHGKTFDSTQLSCCSDGQVAAQCDFDPCYPNPCENGGVCSHGEVGHAVCTCSSGFEGLYCETVGFFALQSNTKIAQVIVSTYGGLFGRLQLLLLVQQVFK